MNTQTFNARITHPKTLAERLRTASTTSLLPLFLLTLPVAVQAQFTYVTNNGAIAITGYTGPSGDVVIPDTITGLPVTSVADWAFYNGGRPQPYTLTGVKIPNTVISIGRYAFAWSGYLRNVTLGNGLISIGEGAFGDCGLTTITIPRSVSSIGDVAFAYCALTGVYFLGNAPNLGGPSVFQGFGAYPTVYYMSGTTGWGPTFGGCPTALWFPPPSDYTYTTANGTITITGYTGPGGDVTIPDTIIGLPVTTIGYEAFYDCTSLTSVTIPNTVTDIGDQAFSYCRSLTNVMIPNSVTSIGSGAFDLCSSLTSVTIPNSVPNIGDMAFFQCSSLTSVTIPNSVTSIGGSAFSYCRSLTNVTIGSGVTNIGDYAFQGCTSLTSVMIPDSVNSIGDGAFYSCLNLATVTIPNSVTNIGDSAFAGCARLLAIAVDALNPAYTSVDGVLFNKRQTTLFTCPGGTPGNYTIPSGVTNIGHLAFLNCFSLTDVSIPNSVTSLGGGAFYNCTSLTNVTIPEGVTSISAATFCGCSDLRTVTIPNSVTSIGDRAFEFCTNLTSVTIPGNVASIEYGAFISCTSLTSVYFKGNAPILGGPDVFNGANNATVYYLPGTTGWGTTFGGRPTALWVQVPIIQTVPQTQTAEAGSAVRLGVKASSPLPLFYFWYLNATNLLSSGTNWQLDLPSVQLSQSGAYTVVISNVLGAVTTSPAMLNVIASVERRPVPGVMVTGAAGSLLNIDCADSLSPAPTWTPLGSVTLTGTPQYCFDLTLPLPPQRFYRAWQTGTPSVRPFLDLHPVPAITLTGTTGHSVRVDYINQFGPTDAWVTLTTVPLTNTSQLYFDISAPGRPPRLYRLVPSP